LLAAWLDGGMGESNGATSRRAGECGFELPG